MEAKQKVTIGVAARVGFRGVWALGRHFDAGQHELEVTAAELEALRTRVTQGVSVVVHPVAAVEEPAAPVAHGGEGSGKDKGGRR